MNAINNSTQYAAASAMNAISLQVAVSANNLANISTAGFVPQRGTYSTGRAGQSVLFDSVLSQAQSLTPWSAANAVFDVTPNQFSERITPSGTDVAAESSHLISMQHAYEANAKIVQTSDSMLGTLLDIRA